MRSNHKCLQGKREDADDIYWKEVGKRSKYWDADPALEMFNIYSTPMLLIFAHECGLFPVANDEGDKGWW